jgi:hypothetical protein
LSSAPRPPDEGSQELIARPDERLTAEEGRLLELLLMLPVPFQLISPMFYTGSPSG